MRLMCLDDNLSNSKIVFSETDWSFLCPTSPGNTLSKNKVSQNDQSTEQAKDRIQCFYGHPRRNQLKLA